MTSRTTPASVINYFPFSLGESTQPPPLSMFYPQTRSSFLTQNRGGVLVLLYRFVHFFSPTQILILMCFVIYVTYCLFGPIGANACLYRRSPFPFFARDVGAPSDPTGCSPVLPSSYRSRLPFPPTVYVPHRSGPFLPSSSRRRALFMAFRSLVHFFPPFSKLHCPTPAPGETPPHWEYFFFFFVDDLRCSTHCFGSCDSLFVCFSHNVILSFFW